MPTDRRAKQSYNRFMPANVLKIFPFIPIAFLLAACASTPEASVGGGGVIHERNQGYSLLYKLMSDEADVGKIFILKGADDSVKNLVKEIGNGCQGAKKQLEEFAKQDAQLGYNTSDLPYIESRQRELQAKEEEKSLLFSSGKEFELKLLFTQAEAMNYAKQLCKALSEKEDNATRKTFLDNFAKQAADYHDRLMKLLTVQS
jgi:hypothetical protein